MGTLSGALALNVRTQERNVQKIMAVGTILTCALNLQT